MPNGGESALLVEVPEAEALTSELRLRHDPVAARGVPAHVTVLFPFCGPEQLDDPMLASVRALAAAHAPFEFSLERIEEFPGTVWLAPEPAAPFQALTLDAAARFPDHPPYSGLFSDIVPHLTVGHAAPEAIPELRAEVKRAVNGYLPLAATARTLALWSHEGEEWRRFAAFPLGG
ncbi:MAG TPA: 2'-5' RNA ligase family protein [Acidimicrobiia bacterium]|nr:2'-5' RNA ligase family protein [Acidimicrobiia bacterium]